MKDYSKMRMPELDQAKHALEKERADLRAKLRALSDEEKDDIAKTDPILKGLQAIRAEMLKIQDAQDVILASPDSVVKNDNVHVIGVSGIKSEESVQGIGGSKKSK